MELQMRGDSNCASVSGEIDSEEGYCTLFVIVKFKNFLSPEFAEFMQEYMEKHGVTGNIPPEYEVGLTSDPASLYIDFNAGHTEFSHFEDYFEGPDFVDFMEKAVKEWVSK